MDLSNEYLGYIRVISWGLVEIGKDKTRLRQPAAKAPCAPLPRQSRRRLTPADRGLRLPKGPCAQLAYILWQCTDIGAALRPQYILFGYMDT